MNTPNLEYSEDKAKQGIQLLAHNADMLEQVAIHFGAILENEYSSAHREALGIQIQSSASGGRELHKNGAKVIVYTDDGRHETSNNEMVAKRADGMVVSETSLALAAITQAGILAHEVNLDHRELTFGEKQLIEGLPHHMEVVGKVMDSYATRHKATVENKQEVIQAKRDVKYLAKLKEELGDLGGQVTHYNALLVDRQSDLVTETDIAADKAKKFTDGLTMLAQSDTHAKTNNPAYRERIAKRKPIEIADHTHDVNGNARLDKDGQPVKYVKRDDSVNTR